MSVTRRQQLTPVCWHQSAPEGTVNYFRRSRKTSGHKTCCACAAKMQRHTGCARRCQWQHWTYQPSPFRPDSVSKKAGVCFVTHVMGHFVHAPRHTPRWLGEAARRGRLHAVRLQPGHGSHRASQIRLLVTRSLRYSVLRASTLATTCAYGKRISTLHTDAFLWTPATVNSHGSPFCATALQSQHSM